MITAALAFVAGVERVQQDLGRVLGAAELALIAWAWQRRGILGPSTDELVAGLPEPWQQAARVLLATWNGAARASSAVEGWHSILRPHLAVHRTLSAGLLALVAVWHNHRVFPRGIHRGSSPLQLSGMPEAPSDWLVALGYPPATAIPHPVAAHLRVTAGVGGVIAELSSCFELCLSANDGHQGILAPTGKSFMAVAGAGGCATYLARSKRTRTLPSVAR